jgi:hypothetical protein
MTDQTFKTVSLIKECEKKLDEIAGSIDISECEFYQEYLNQIEDAIDEKAPYIKEELNIDSYARDWWSDYTYDYYR